MKRRLQALCRWCELVWRRYLDDLARLLVGDLEVAAGGRQGRDPWGR